MYLQISILKKKSFLNRVQILGKHFTTPGGLKTVDLYWLLADLPQLIL
jgi:hypothetical protein